MEFLYEIEKERNMEGKIKFVVSFNDKDNSWYL